MVKDENMSAPQSLTADTISTEHYDKITFESNLQPSSQVWQKEKTVVVRFPFAKELSPFAI